MVQHHRKHGEDLLPELQKDAEVDQEARQRRQKETGWISDLRQADEQQHGGEGAGIAVDGVPKLGAAYGELVRVLRSNDAPIRLVGRIMAQDMGMTAKVLQLVNSAFFGVSREITNPVDAVVYLGMETVRACPSRLTSRWSSCAGG